MAKIWRSPNFFIETGSSIAERFQSRISRCILLGAYYKLTHRLHRPRPCFTIMIFMYALTTFSFTINQTDERNTREGASLSLKPFESLLGWFTVEESLLPLADDLRRRFVSQVKNPFSERAIAHARSRERETRRHNDLILNYRAI